MLKVCDNEVLVTHRVWLFATPWTGAHQALLVHGILQARTPEQVAISSSRRSCLPRDGTWVSCIADEFLTIWVTGKSPKWTLGQCWYLNGGQSKFHCSTNFMITLSHFFVFHDSVHKISPLRLFSVFDLLRSTSNRLYAPQKYLSFKENNALGRLIV